MLSQLPTLRHLKKNTLVQHILLISLLIFIVFISLLWSDTQSLIAHDEGLYAKRAKLILDSGDWLSPFPSPHHKTIGSYWAIAISLKLFGVNDWSSRLPSIIAGLIATLLFYLTASRYFKPLNSLTASLALISMPIYFQSLRTAGPDMVFVALIMAQIYFLISAKDLSCKSFRWKIFSFGVCVSLAFFVRSIVALIPLVSLLPLIFVLKYLRIKEFWIWAVSGLLLGSVPLLFSLLSVFGDHGYAGLISLVSFASRKADLSESYLFSSFPFYFTRIVCLTFPAFVFLLPRIKSFRQIIFTSKHRISQIELNSLALLFPLIYFMALSCMGTKYYHYLTPLVPILALNIARIDLFPKRGKFEFESNFALFMGAIYLLGACALYFKREVLLVAPFYFGFFALLLSSILCFGIFYCKSIYRLRISPFALIFAFLMAQYLAIFALSASGIIWNTNKELKFLANAVNSDCSSGAYLYGLSSKDRTILTFYLDDSYVLESLSSLSAAPRRCLISKEAKKKAVLKSLHNDQISNFYFR